MSNFSEEVALVNEIEETADSITATFHSKTCSSGTQPHEARYVSYHNSSNYELLCFIGTPMVFVFHRQRRRRV